MDSITITITDKRVIDGYIFTANKSKLDPTDFATKVAILQGKRIADGNNIGVITASAFIARFTPSEYGAILSASQTEPTGQVAQIVNELLNSTTFSLTDERLIPYLQTLVSEGLLEESRIEELLYYERPIPEYPQEVV